MADYSFVFTDDLDSPPMRCMVCHRERSEGMADAIAHAPCDQRVARLDPDTPEPGFWGSVGLAGYDE